MRPKSTLILGATILLCAIALASRADQIQMQNGDRYGGKVLSMSTTNVVFESEVLGKINLPRKNVATMAFGTNALSAKPSTEVARVSTTPLSRTNLPTAALVIKPTPATATNADISAALRGLGGNTNFIREVREKLLAGSPEASAKYDEMVNSLMTGKLDMNGLRKQAADSANQLRALKKELGPEADDTLDGYLQVLETFLNQSGSGSSIETPR